MQYIRSDILTRSQHVLVASGSHEGGAGSVNKVLMSTPSLLELLNELNG